MHISGIEEDLKSLKERLKEQKLSQMNSKCIIGKSRMPNGSLQLQHHLGIVLGSPRDLNAFQTVSGRNRRFTDVRTGQILGTLYPGDDTWDDNARIIG